MSALLWPPLVQSRFPELPLGVSTLTFTGPEADMTSVVSFTFSWSSLTTVALSGVELITTSDDETKSLPLTVSIKPCCTCAKLTVLGDSEPITGMGRALPHKGFRVLLQPATKKRAGRTARERARLRENMGVTPSERIPPVSQLESSGITRAGAEINVTRLKQVGCHRAAKREQSRNCNVL
jgi:hypothetical protein